MPHMMSRSRSMPMPMPAPMSLTAAEAASGCTIEQGQFPWQWKKCCPDARGVYKCEPITITSKLPAQGALLLAPGAFFQRSRGRRG